jgi:ABC-type amino acid transport substrate-binding protein
VLSSEDLRNECARSIQTSGFDRDQQRRGGERMALGGHARLSAGTTQAMLDADRTEGPMRHWLAGMVFIVGAVGEVAAQDLPQIDARGTLRVLVVPPPPDQPEFWPASPNDQRGFEREMVDAFAASRRLRVEVVAVEQWVDLVPALLAGRGDMIVGRFTETPSRAEKVAFTSSIFPTRNVAVTLHPHRVIRTLEELREEKVGTVVATSLEEVVRAAGIPPGQIEALPPGTLLSSLRRGKVTCIVWGLDAAIPAQQADPKLQIGTFVGAPGSLAWGVRKTSPALLGKVNEFIAAHKTAKWSELVTKYFGPAAADLLRRSRSSN